LTATEPFSAFISFNREITRKDTNLLNDFVLFRVISRFFFYAANKSDAKTAFTNAPTAVSIINTAYQTPLTRFFSIIPAFR